MVSHSSSDPLVTLFSPMSRGLSLSLFHWLLVGAAAVGAGSGSW